ncbi:MAG: HIRAN domain-containing protein [Bacteroidales bacterium]
MIYVILFVVAFWIILVKYGSKNEPTKTDKLSKYCKQLEVERQQKWIESDIKFESLAGPRHHLVDGKMDLAIDEPMYLFPDETNKFDSNAVKVVNKRGVLVGYISKSISDLFCKDIKDGVFFIAKVKSIDLSEPQYPYVLLEIRRTKERSDLDLNDEEIKQLEILSRESDNLELAKKEMIRLHIEKGVEFEKEKNIQEAINEYRHCINSYHSRYYPYKRLAILYRKVKDIDNEIDILKTALKFYKQDHTKHILYIEDKKEIKDRLLKAYEIKEKLTKK